MPPNSRTNAKPTDAMPSIDTCLATLSRLLDWKKFSEVIEKKITSTRSTAYIPYLFNTSTTLAAILSLSKYFIGSFLCFV
jgi:hypothetical protein